MWSEKYWGKTFDKCQADNGPQTPARPSCRWFTPSCGQKSTGETPSTKYWGNTSDKWLVRSVDKDQWMIILLAMSVGKIRPEYIEVTVLRVVGEQTKFLLVNQAYAKTCSLKDGSKSSWPAGDLNGWIPSDEEKARLSGCDFLPAISGLPFEKMWRAALKSVREQGVLKSTSPWP